MDEDGSPPPPPEQNGSITGSPSEFLRNIVGKKVKVRIGSGVDYHGELAPPICPAEEGHIYLITALTTQAY